MQELLRNAWLGWQNYIDAGKYIVFVLVILLFVWFGKNNGASEMQTTDALEKKHVLFIYSAIMVVACICPVTAAVLMMYQTRFYDYQWIWCLVPVTMLIGVGLVGLYLRYVEKMRTDAKAVIVLMTVGILTLAGRMGAPIEQTVDVEQKRLVECVIAQVKEEAAGEPICLWAPQEVMTYVRALDGEIILPYGRDMWDAHLGAYSYDTYSPEVQGLYEYMSGMQLWGEFDPNVADDNGKTVILEGEKYMAQAVQLGITHVLLPQNALPETVKSAEELLGVKAQTIEGYYLLVLTQ